MKPKEFAHEELERKVLTAVQFGYAGSGYITSTGEVKFVFILDYHFN